MSYYESTQYEVTFIKKMNPCQNKSKICDSELILMAIY